MEPIYGIIGNRRIPDRASRGLRQCPYCPREINSAHFPLHLTKCSQSDPRNAELFSVCQYDYSHHILSEKMTEHLQECPARDAFLFRETRAGNGTLEDQMGELRTQLLTMKPELERRMRQKQFIAQREEQKQKSLDLDRQKNSESPRVVELHDVRQDANDLVVTSDLYRSQLLETEMPQEQEDSLSSSADKSLQQSNYFQRFSSSVRSFFNV